MPTRRDGRWQDRLSPNDQRDFDRYYSQWIDDTRRNDRDEVSRDAGRLQEIMTRNNIPADVPFDRIASPGPDRANDYPTVESTGRGREDYPQMTSTTSIATMQNGSRIRARTIGTILTGMFATCKTSWREITFRLMFPSIELHPRMLLRGTKSSHYP